MANRNKYNFRLPITTRMEGIPQSIAALKRVRRGLRPAGKKGMRRAMNYLLRETRKVTPKDKGDLRKSGRVEISEDSLGVITGMISFYIYYAIWVHEDLTKFHAPGTYAKFLERTVRNLRHQSVARAMIADELIKQERKDLR